jgi:flavorubredoxin
MKAIELKDGIYWVGGIDWRLRNFHGYLTQRGSTYNAYLILDEKITLIDTVKHYLYDEMLERISAVVDPAKIDCLICNHVEMDHSGSFPRVREIVKNAQMYASPKGVEGLKAHFGDLNVTAVKTGDTISIGKRTLAFVQTPMVHWPDNMITYCPEERALFSNDAFGQHIGSDERFDDEFPLDIILEEARKYYANIVLPYGTQVRKALAAASTLDIQTIAPSHGLIWRKNIPTIVAEYTKWAANETEERAVVIYDTMWQSTAALARTITDTFDSKGIPAEPICLQDTHISDIMTRLLTARYICVGSPTLNSGVLPPVGAFLTYMCGLAPKNRVGLAFGSYGWGGQSVDKIQSQLAEAGFTMLEPIKVKYIPSNETLAEIRTTLSGTLPVA